jgi:hypothetical protein
MMNEFKITMARIEVLAPDENDEQVRLTFQIDGASRSFQVPILLSIKDFDDTKRRGMLCIGHSLNSQPKAKNES